MVARFRLQLKEFVSNLFQLRYREVLMTIAFIITVVTTFVLFPGWDSTTTGLQTEVTVVDFTLLFLVAAFAGIIKGMIGFGFTSLVTPVFAILINPVVAVVVLSIPPWALNVFQIGESHTGWILIKREWMLIGLTVLGSVIGVFALSEIVLDAEILLLIGILMWGYVGVQIIQGFVTLPQASHPAIRGSIGFITGLIMAITNIGLIFPIYVHLFERNTERYVGLLGVLYFFLLSQRILQMSFIGLLTPYFLWLGSAIAVVSIVGLGIGSYLRRLKVNERRFNWLIVTMLFLIGLNILLNFAR